MVAVTFSSISKSTAHTPKSTAEKKNLNWKRRKRKRSRWQGRERERESEEEKNDEMNSRTLNYSFIAIWSFSNFFPRSSFLPVESTPLVVLVFRLFLGRSLDWVCVYEGAQECRWFVHSIRTNHSLIRYHHIGVFVLIVDAVARSFVRSVRSVRFFIAFSVYSSFFRFVFLFASRN